MRKVKQLYIKQFGYDRGVAQAQTLRQLQAAIPSGIYDAIERNIELQAKRRQLASNCTHATRHNMGMLLLHYLNLSNPNNAPTVSLTVPPRYLKLKDDEQPPSEPRTI